MNRMNTLRVVGLLLCTTFLLGASQCQQKQQNDQTNGSPVFVTTLSLQDVNGNVKNTFEAGTPIVLKLTVYNRSDAVQTLSFGDSQQYNFAAVNAGTGSIVWYWSWNHFFLTMVTNLVFQPHETQSFTVNWDQTDNSGVQLPIGQYEIFGGMTGHLVGIGDSTPGNDDAMAPALPEPTQMSPTQFRSTLDMFTITAASP